MQESMKGCRLHICSLRKDTSNTNIASISSSNLVGAVTSSRPRRSLIRCLVESVRETSTEWVRFAHYLHQLSSWSWLVCTTSSLEAESQMKEHIPNPPKSGLKGIYNQLPSLNLTKGTYRSILGPTIIKRLSTTLHSHPPYSRSPTLHSCGDGWW